MQAHTQEGNYASAVDTFERMVHAGLCPSEATYAILLFTPANAGLIEETERAVEDVSDRYPAPPALLAQAMITAHTAHGSRRVAEQVLSQRLSEGLAPTDGLFLPLLMEAGRGGRFEDVLRILGKAHEA
eukprot:5149262-Amphidinium_carterae.1